MAADAVAVAGHGAIGKGRNRVDVINSNDGGTSTAYLAGRLKRDNPELAEQVIAGQISAHAAAVQAGIRKPTWTAPADPERLAQAIERKSPGWSLHPVHAADTHRQPVQAHAPQQQAAPQPQSTCTPYVPVLDHGQPSHGYMLAEIILCVK